MKHLSKFLPVFLVILFATVLMSEKSNAQQVCDCNGDVPRLTILNHPNALGPNNQGQYTYQYPPRTVYRRVTCGANPFIPVDPCDPYSLEFYCAIFESEDDCVIFDSISINWDTTICHDLRYEFVYPNGYVAGTPADSIVLKVTMGAHQADTCDFQKTYWCRNEPNHWIDIDCWVNCVDQRIGIYAHDACPFPNIAICRIEWDNPLPVELESFTSSVSGNNVTLSWITSSETNNAGFKVERESEGVWKEVGFVAGNGTVTGSSSYSYTDKNLHSGAYMYRLKQTDYNGNYEYYTLQGVVSVGAPEKYLLAQNYPNPFNPSTTILYGIPEAGFVSLKVYDMNGKEMMKLVEMNLDAGFYTAKLNASNLPSGMYFYKLESGKFVTTKKMILMK